MFWNLYPQFLLLHAMKKISTILLLSLLLIPLFWNGMSFIHYLVEHTHTFCTSEQDHQHTLTEECPTICHITPQHEQDQIPHNIEFHELKQCITTCASFNAQFAFSYQISTNSDYTLLYGRILSEDIFRPPIS